MRAKMYVLLYLVLILVKKGDSERLSDFYDRLLASSGYCLKTNSQVQLVNLLISAKKGDLPLLIRYYEQKINFNWSDYDGRTALHFAIEGGHLNIVKFLIDKCQVELVNMGGGGGGGVSI